MNVLHLTTITFSLTLLAACGGGGGGGASPTSNLERLPAILVNAGEARQIVQAIDATDTERGLNPNFSSTEVERGIAAIATEGNALLLSESVSAGTMFSASRMINCVGMVTCQATITTDISGVEDTTMEEYIITDIAGPLLIGDEDDFTRFNGQFSTVMTDRGIRLAQTRAAGRRPIEEGGTPVRHEFQSYIGWMEHSAFTVQLQKSGTGNMEAVGLGAYSFGNAPGSATTPTGQGSVTWEGIMVGAFTTDDNDIVHGNATIDIDDLSAADVDVLFSNIRNLNDRSARIDDLMWDNLTLGANGTFSGMNNSIQGVFYGPAYEEVGGIFDMNNIIGAFGARRPATQGGG